MKKGFTLIELLAVIVILAIIAIIAVPIVLNVIKDAQDKANIESAKMYLKAVEMAVAQENLNTNDKIDPINCKVLQDQTGDLSCDEDTENYQHIKVEVDNPATDGTIIFENGKIVTVIKLEINKAYFDFSNGNLELLKEYTVKFDSNGGSKVDSIQVLKNRTIDQPNNPTREGYNFKGWQLNGQDYNFDTPITNNITLKAKWESQVAYMLTAGTTFSSRIKTLANGENKVYNATDEVIKAISFYSNGELPEGYTLESLTSLSSTDVSSDNKKTIMAYHDGNGNIYVYSEGQITSNSSSGQNSSTYLTFNNLRSLTSVNLTQFDTSNSKSMYAMFNGCTNLTSLDLSSLRTKSVESMQSMFSGCTGLTSLIFPLNFIGESVTDMSGMFMNCSNLTSIDLSNSNSKNVKYMQEMFYNCVGLTSINLSNFDTSSVQNMQSMFYNCKSLTELDLSDFNTSEVTNMIGMFRECRNLTKLKIKNFNTNKVASMANMFLLCSSLEIVDLSDSQTPRLTNIGNMFQQTYSIKTIDLRSADLSGVTSKNYFLLDVPKTVTIYLKDTQANRDFMSTNFPSYTPTYITPTE